MKKLTYEFIKNQFEKREYELLETNYVNSMTKMKFKCNKHPDKELSIRYGDLRKGHGCRYCGLELRSQNVRKTHEQFSEEALKYNPNITIIGTYIGANNKVDVKCNIDNHIWGITIGHLREGKGCPVCAGKVVKQGINDIATTHPEIAKLIVDQELIYTISYGSAKKVMFRCPYCRNVSERNLNNVTRQGFSCSSCSDGISFPDKFIFNLFKSLNIDCEPHKRFEWSQNKEYDLYIEKTSTIIEMQGSQHKNNKNFEYLGGRTLEEEIKNDKLKKELALENGIQNYIYIDAEYSTTDFLKNNILSSDLASLYNFTNIKWEEIGKQSERSNVIEACKLWEEGFSLDEISHKLGISKITSTQYMKKGIELKLCNYTSKEARNRNRPVIILESCKLWNDGLSLPEISNKLNRNKQIIAGHLSDGTKLGLCNYTSTEARSRSHKKKG